MATQIIPLLTDKVVAAFWKKVMKGGGCWLWTASRHEKGYGQYLTEGRLLRAHRMSFALHNNIEPGELQVCHTCDNPWCVNPAHLWLGTSQENMDDKVAKGNHLKVVRGIQHHKTKLSEEDVYAIREKLAHGMGLRAIGREFGVDFTTIRSIRNGETWKHLTQRL